MRANLRTWAPVVGWAVGTRALVLATVALMTWLHWPRGYFAHTLIRHPLGPLGGWDGIWYRTVAGRGYLLIPGRQSDPAFFPLLPMLLRGLHAVGLPYLGGGLLVSNLAFVVAVVAFYELGRTLLPEDVARRAAILVAVFPIGFVFSMLYPESIVFAAIAVSLATAVRGRWTLAAVAGAIAGLGRPEALLLAIPLAALAFQQWRLLTPRARAEAVGATLAPAATAASFPLYLSWSLHNLHAWTWAQRSWDRSFKLDGVYRAFVDLGSSWHHNGWLARDVVFVAVYLVLLALARRTGVGWAWIVAGALIVLLPLTSGSFESEARLGLLALPAYWGLAAATRRRAVLVGVVALSLVLLVAGTLTLPLTYP